MVHILGHNQRIEYEGLHHFCFDYGQYSHRLDHYSKKAPSLVEAQPNQKTTAQERAKIPNRNEIDVNNPHGPWMVVVQGEADGKLVVIGDNENPSARKVYGKEADLCPIGGSDPNTSSNGQVVQISTGGKNRETTSRDRNNKTTIAAAASTNGLGSRS